MFEAIKTAIARAKARAAERERLKVMARYNIRELELMEQLAMMPERHKPIGRLFLSHNRASEAMWGIESILEKLAAHKEGEDIPDKAIEYAKAAEKLVSDIEEQLWGFIREQYETQVNAYESK